MTGLVLSDEANRNSYEVEALRDSYTHLLVVSFGASTSRNFRAAVQLVSAAEKYRHVDLGGSRIYVAAFGKTREQAASARLLLQYVTKWKTTQVWAGGSFFLNYWEAIKTLDCYLQATAPALKDSRAHCCEIIDDPKAPPRPRTGMLMTIQLRMPGELAEPKEGAVEAPVDRYSFPCRLMRWRFRYQHQHPSNLREQIQASAVQEHVDWCPLFTTDNFRKVEP